MSELQLTHWKSRLLIVYMLAMTIVLLDLTQVDAQSGRRRRNRLMRMRDSEIRKQHDEAKTLSILRDLVPIKSYTQLDAIADPVSNDPTAKSSADVNSIYIIDQDISTDALETESQFEGILSEFQEELDSEEGRSGVDTAEPATEAALPMVDDRQLFASQLRAQVQDSLLAGLPPSVAELTSATHARDLWKDINTEGNRRKILLTNLRQLRRSYRHSEPCENEPTHMDQLKCLRRDAEEIKQQVLKRVVQLTKGIRVLANSSHFKEDVYKAHGDFSSLPESQAITRLINQRKLLATLSTDSDPQGTAAILDNGLAAFEDDFQSKEDMNMLRLAVSAKLFLLRDYETANRVLDGIATDKLIRKSASEVLAALQQKLVGNGGSKATRSLLDVLGSDFRYQIETLSTLKQERLDELLRRSQMAAELEAIILIDVYRLCDNLLFLADNFKTRDTKEASSP